MSTPGVDDARATRRTRAGALFALVLLASGVLYVIHTAYYALTDSFVGPIALSPESDTVITSNLRLNQLYAERAKLAVELERIDAEMSANTQAIDRLKALLRLAGDALSWDSAVSAEQASAGSQDLAALQERERAVAAMIEKQEHFVAELKKDMEAGLVSRADYLKESQALSQMRLAAIDTGRYRLSTTLQVKQARMVLQGSTRAAAGSAAAPLTPQALADKHQTVRLELELIKLEADKRAAEAKRRVVAAEIEKIDELTQQMRARPLYRAIESRMDVAFVPYTQMEGVRRGASVHECIWGLFACQEVGTVSELLPGEVVMPDPWGSETRGQYAILSLTDEEASKARLLRVRAAAGQEPAREPSVPALVDSRAQTTVQ